MNIAVLGPSGTYTEKAAKEYMQRRNLEGQLQYYSSMRKTLDAIGTECSYGVIPIENTLDGFVQIILDLLTHSKLKIIHEIVLPIRFGFISNANTLSQVERVYAQFKTHNQCLDFLENFTEDQIITTQSNSASYQMLIEGKKTDGAIVPMHFLHQEQSFALEMDDVADSVENETRFIVLSTELNDEVSASEDWKTLLVIHDDQDRPGLLVDILNVFAKEKINLVSIISRPTKKGLGNYNFFIDVEGCYQRNKKVREAVLQVMNEFNVVVLGSYYRVK
jgi:prephenate dehydratase